MFFVIMFVSPLYFLIRGKWLGFFVNSFLYGLAVLTILFGIGVIFWALGVAHAGWHYRRELMVEQANMIARAMGTGSVHAVDHGVRHVR